MKKQNESILHNILLQSMMSLIVKETQMFGVKKCSLTLRQRQFVHVDLLCDVEKQINKCLSVKDETGELLLKRKICTIVV